MKQRNKLDHDDDSCGLPHKSLVGYMVAEYIIEEQNGKNEPY